VASRVRKAKDEVIKAMRVRLVDLVSYSRNVLGTDAIRLGFVGSPALCLAKLAKEDYPMRTIRKVTQVPVRERPLPNDVVFPAGADHLVSQKSTVQ